MSCVALGEFLATQPYVSQVNAQTPSRRNWPRSARWARSPSASSEDLHGSLPRLGRGLRQVRRSPAGSALQEEAHVIEHSTSTSEAEDYNA